MPHLVWLSGQLQQARWGGGLCSTLVLLCPLVPILSLRVILLLKPDIESSELLSPQKWPRCCTWSKKLHIWLLLGACLTLPSLVPWYLSRWLCGCGATAASRVPVLTRWVTSLAVRACRVLKASPWLQIYLEGNREGTKPVIAARTAWCQHSRAAGSQWSCCPCLYEAFPGLQNDVVCLVGFDGAKLSVCKGELATAPPAVQKVIRVSGNPACNIRNSSYRWKITKVQGVLTCSTPDIRFLGKDPEESGNRGTWWIISGLASMQLISVSLCSSWQLEGCGNAAPFSLPLLFLLC